MQGTDDFTGAVYSRPMLLVAVVSLITLTHALRMATRHGTTAYLDALAARAYVNSRLRACNGSPSQFVVPLNLTSQRVVDVANPVDAQDVATKSYVDALAPGGIIQTRLFGGAANGNVMRFSFPSGKSITNGKIALVGFWIGQIDSSNNIVWVNAYTFIGSITELFLLVKNSEVTLNVDGFPNSSGNVLIQYIEYP